MQTSRGYIEGAHVNFCRPKKFLSNLRTFDFDNVEVSLQHRGASLCNQLLQEFQAINLHTEDVHVHVPFSKQENNFFDKITAFST